MLNLTPQQLRQAAAIKERIEALQRELSRILDGSAPVVGTAAGPKRRKMSAAAIARIRAAAKARWAKFRAARPAVKTGARRRKKISAAGRARLSALAKARWAKAKAQGKHAL